MTNLQSQFLPLWRITQELGISVYTIFRSCSDIIVVMMVKKMKITNTESLSNGGRMKDESLGKLVDCCATNAF
jgi:hypothetical protein